MAAEKDHTAVIEALGKFGADVNQASKDGMAPMHGAAVGSTAAIEALGKLGADVNRASNAGWTPLKRAIDSSHTAAAEALRRLGAA